MLSVICPVLNEEEFIEKVLNFLINSKPLDKEIIFIDGGSTDRTTSIIESWRNKYSCIYILHNHKKYVPFSLNLGIQESKGEIIVRIDAHTEYAEDYFEQIIKTFNEVDADIVGGPTRVANGTDFQNAVAAAISNPFGIGDSKVHNFKYRGYTDHVTFGAWKKNIFSEIGYFDEQLIRNQDDEFHYRAKSKGKKIYMNPEIKLWYHPRKTLKRLFTQYFQYGYYKPLVLKKVKSEIKIRHLIPSIFIIYLITTPIIYIHLLWSIPANIYLATIFLVILKSKLNLKQKLLSVFVYPTIHIGYGLGVIIGIRKIF